jgi:FAD:protein FMN transferase
VVASPLFPALAAALFAVLLGGCGDPRDPVIEITGPTMGTYFAVKVPRPPAGLDPQVLQAGVERVLGEVNGEISTYDPESELSRLNRNPSTDWIPVSARLHTILAEGLRISGLTGGAFDITVGPLVNLWGFGPDVQADAVPPPDRIAAALERVGYQKIALRADPPALRKARGDLFIDLSALGEGYGADRLAAYLDSQGVTDFMVAVAGTIRARGRNAKGQPWGIAVEAPTEGQRKVQRVVLLSDGAVSTSGDYRNFFEQGGRRYSHHIDPRTGDSVAHRLASATVVMPPGLGSAMSADGLATALVVMGEEQGPALAESLSLAAYFILREGEGRAELSSTAFGRMQTP